jgi:cobalt-zinc-cadmium efflux system membrane fusion protein
VSDLGRNKEASDVMTSSNSSNGRRSRRAGRIATAAILVIAAIAVWLIGPRKVARLAWLRAEEPPAAADEDDVFKVTGQTIGVPASAARTMGLETLTTSPRRVPVTLRLTGRTGLDTETVTHIRGQFPGRVLDIGPALGSIVHGPEDADQFGGAPTVMCVVESTDLAQAKSDYLKAKVTLEVDEDGLKRTKELVDAKVLADKFLLDAQSAVKKDQADYDATRQKLLVFGLKDADLPLIDKQQGRQRMVYSIPCPKSGVITEKNVTRGELADPTVNLFTIADLSKIWIWGDVYERDRRRVKEGQKMTVIVASHPDEPRECTVEWVSPVLDANTRSIRIRGSLDNRDGRLLADMYCTILLQIEDPKDSILLPSDAVVRREDAAFVFVRTTAAADGSATYERRAVKVEPVGSGIGFESTPVAAAATAPAATADAARSVEGRRARPPEVFRVLEGLSATGGDVVVIRGALGLTSEMEQHAGS